MLEEAVRLGALAFDAFTSHIAREGFGKSERQLHFDAFSALTDKGSYPVSFDPIVAIGPNAAKPHAIPGDRVLRGGDLLLIDAGIKYQRYCSDRTRTVAVSKTVDAGIIQRFDDPEMQRVYDTVRNAHDLAIEKARCGMKAKEIDAIAREVIREAGYGEYFVHSLGHGVGLDIHEYPFINARSETVVEEGMVFTIEPGIYLPDRFGVRIEDMVVMEQGRPRVL